MMKRSLGYLSGLLLTLALVVTTHEAHAAEVPNLDPDNSGWITVIVALVLAVGVGVSSFINPKRTHQD